MYVMYIPVPKLIILTTNKDVRDTITIDLTWVFPHHLEKYKNIWKTWEHLLAWKKNYAGAGYYFSYSKLSFFNRNDNWISRENSPHEYKCRSMLTVFFLQVQKHIMCSELHYHLTSFPIFPIFGTMCCKICKDLGKVCTFLKWEALKKTCIVWSRGFYPPQFLKWGVTIHLWLYSKAKNMNFSAGLSLLILLFSHN